MNNVTEETIKSDNIRTVQQVYSAFAKRDIMGILDLLDPEIQWGEPANPHNPSAGTRHGHAGFLEWLEIGRQCEEILVLQPRKFLADSDTVAVIGYTKCLAKPTGKTYETDFVHLVTLTEGRIVRFQEYFDTYAAAEAFKP
jgi:uncharacterized protein